MSGWFWIVAAIGVIVVVGGLADYLLLALPGYQPVPLVMDPVPTLLIPGTLAHAIRLGICSGMAPAPLWTQQRCCSGLLRQMARCICVGSLT